MIVGFMAIRSMLRSSSGRRKSRPVRNQRLGRVHELARLIQFARKWQYSRWNLAHYLTDLEMDVLALHGHGDFKEIQQHLRAGTIDMDEEVSAYFQLGLSKYLLPQQKNLITRIKERFGLVKPDESPAPLDLERVVTFLEHQLEISHEHKSV
jgi:hypothetical protein